MTDDAVAGRVAQLEADIRGGRWACVEGVEENISWLLDHLTAAERWRQAWQATARSYQTQAARHAERAKGLRERVLAAEQARDHAVRELQLQAYSFAAVVQERDQARAGMEEYARRNLDNVMQLAAAEARLETLAALEAAARAWAHWIWTTPGHVGDEYGPLEFALLDAVAALAAPPGETGTADAAV